MTKEEATKAKEVIDKMLKIQAQSIKEYLF